MEEYRDEFEQHLTKKEKKKIDELDRDIFKSFTLLQKQMKKKELPKEELSDLNFGSSCNDIDDLQIGEKNYLEYLEIYQDLFGKKILLSQGG